MRTHRIIILLLLGLAFTACEKQNVKNEDDPFISPTGEGAAPSNEAQGAGDPGQPATDLQIVYFPFDSSILTTEASEALKSNAAYLRDNPSVQVQIEGHCDERGTVEYNLALGERRARAAKTQLKKLGIEDRRLSTISYGKERPSDSGHDETAWAKNRRAVFVLSPQ